ncbi:uncharacterized protein BO80DRAFT_405226 [Aspergillus ibericus CBS 121593]|uniref:DNA repair protein XRCC4 n=1 Tax=Aspergillus ibericus CBS 121593 TaxID=1448316 RepID=A0A395H2Q2_9EURO|nr:hypothetical protein BO80DRAFT_405226 [Aspergillus ibericus CBS 121593]RAL02036.1 hypothetical protein BO80DRAFT_405226 [Aspergillus ibericus CBS 121593]
MSSAGLSPLPRILRVPRSDEPDRLVLLHVSPPGPAPLDFNLAATEGEIAYNGVVRQAQLQTYRSKNYQGTHEDWTQIMLYALGQLETSTNGSELLSGVELSASIARRGSEGNELIMVIRRRINTITQRLGSIVLREDDEQAIQLFDWSAVAVTRADFLEQRLSTLQQHYHTAENTINQLNSQIEELISSKIRHEDQLMIAFAQVLNQKKLKIRNQERLLASAKVDMDEVGNDRAASSSIDETIRDTRRVKRGISRISDGFGSGDGFERLGVRTKHRPSFLATDTDDEPISTPQPLEEEDDTTDEDMSASSNVEWRERGEHTPIKAHNSPRTQRRSPPPRRELPFTRSSESRNDTVRKLQHQQDSIGESAGETDDDEL